MPAGRGAGRSGVTRLGWGTNGGNSGAAHGQAEPPRGATRLRNPPPGWAGTATVVVGVGPPPDTRCA